MIPEVPPAFRVEYFSALGPIQQASCVVRAAKIAGLEVDLREQLACWQRVRERDDKVRHRDLVREESR